MMYPVTSKALKFDCLFFVEYFAMDLIMSFGASDDLGGPVDSPMENVAVDHETLG